MSSKSISTFKEETLFNPINHNKNKPNLIKKGENNEKSDCLYTRTFDVSGNVNALSIKRWPF